MKAAVVTVCASEAIERNRRLLIFSLPFAAAAVLMVCFASSGHLTLHLLLFLCGLAGIWLAVDANNPYRESLMVAYTAAYGARVLWILAIAKTGLAFGFLDDRSYDSIARDMVFRIRSLSDFGNLASAYGTHDFGYPFLLAWCYQTFGPLLVSGKLLNAFFGSASVLLAYLIIEELSGNRRLAVAGAWIAAWFAYDIAMTTWLMKDTVLMFFYSLAIAGTIRACRRKSAVYACGAAFGMLGAFTLRFYTAGEVLIGAAAAILAMMAGRLFRGELFKQWAVLLVMIGIAGAGAWLALDQLAKAGPLSDFVQTARYVQQLGDTTAGQLAGFRPLQISLSPAGAKVLVRAVLRYYLAPFAWVFEAPNWWNYFTYPGMLMIYALFPFAVAGVWDSVGNLRPAALFAFVPALVHAAIMVYVYQGGDRQRMMTDVLFVAAACLGWKVRTKHPFLITAAYLGFLLLIYFQKMLEGT